MGIFREALELQASTVINRPSLNCKWNFNRQITNHSKMLRGENQPGVENSTFVGKNLQVLWMGEWPIETLRETGKRVLERIKWRKLMSSNLPIRPSTQGQCEVYILVYSMNICISQSSSFLLLIARSVVQATARHQCHLRGHSSEYSYLHTSVYFYILTSLNPIYLTAETKTCIKSRIFMVSTDSSHLIWITLARQDEPRKSNHTPD